MAHRPPEPMPERRYLLESVGEAAVVQVYCDGFADLSHREKVLAWHLYLATLAGRDIYYDQRYAHGLLMRDVLEALLPHTDAMPASVGEAIRHYTKLFWIHSGPFNTLTSRKFALALTVDEWTAAVCAAAQAGAVLPLDPAESLASLAARLAPLFLDEAVDPIVTNKSPAPGSDILAASANNLYAGVRLADLDGFEERYGLNSRLVKHRDSLVEEVWRVGGRYDAQIRRIVGHLRDAVPWAPPATAEALLALVRFYETGEDADRVAYDIAWVRDADATVDTINGFIEVYMDPRGVKGGWEGIVYCVNRAKTQQIATLAAHAQWFEDRMPWDARFRKSASIGVTAMAIDVVVETGDSGPMTAIGINLPNDQAVRERYGSKSVSLANITEAYDASTPDVMRVEFSWSAEEAERARRWGARAQELTTELHEVIGHGSGQSAPGVTLPPPVLLKEHFSSIEETRADLVALYWLADQKLIELGLVSSADHAELVRAEYESYARTALVQLRRVRHAAHLEEDHMRNRQLIVEWLRANTDAIDVRRRDGKTYFVMTDVAAFRDGVARLLAEVQRIKSEGDCEAARTLVETYGVRFDHMLRDEIVARADALDLPAYTAFVMPRLTADVVDGAIVDVRVSYPESFDDQMLEYSAFARHGRVETPVSPD